MLPIPPDSIIVSLGPIVLRWYGVLYAVGLLVAYQFMVREARRRKLNVDLIINGMIIISIAALAGGRLYHVIDAWDRYSANPLGALIPPYEGLGAPGGIITGTIALAVVLRRWRQSPWGWVDVVGPAILVMQAIARWGNWFNQELYGLPTDLPWGLAVDCAHRTYDTTCTALGEGARFHPLFLYESLSGALGALVLPALGQRLRGRIAPGMIGLAAIAWYAVTRLLLEGLRLDNWKVGGVPTATLVMGGVLLVTLLVAAWRARTIRPQARRRSRR
ncbi:MAG: prolipoprotein diacylglyceryl transferase [Chloroflexi bacterium]|jgi:phosphatidylglycerol:prolipoprotein diacylglycerol transferase|nr:MAG: prolipoprotein diacylglyceryl transferase [Chloroflexota bacterium]